jgi:hypothetical protein
LLDYSEKFGLKKREKIIKIKLNFKYLLYYYVGGKWNKEG